MSDEDNTTDLRYIEDTLVAAFHKASARTSGRQGANATNAALQSIGSIAEAIVTVRKQRHIEEGNGDMYQTRYVQQVPTQRTIRKNPRPTA